MERALQSRLIDAIDYDEESRHLKIFLTNGQRREFDNVPPGVVVGLELAQSPGSFYYTAIRGKYPLQ